ncbi:peptidoglycan DD-metalloendopeptidase family protein [Mesorhizobium xinjiangense]|uniref:peptidoglycan DD-metalloendopeptidase family protein n=1 Tax=Mesorhizobium xinjiangense TaxID=2678685 RepID=UPI0012EDCC1C|nr:peptidoglycan DD-metalloendopeptidase family protein [Mesorhizobium xinjiangense]
MRFGNYGVNRRGLSRLAAILATSSFLAGCSSGVARFENDVYATSASSQSAVMSASANQAYSASAGLAPVDATRTGSINRATVLPPADLGPARGAAPVAVAGSQLPAPISATGAVNTVSAARAPALAPVAGAAPAAGVSQNGVQVAALPSPVGAPAATSPAGSQATSTSGGSHVTVRQGETLYGLSRRFGVPVSAIVAANGLSSANALAAGQTIVIPGSGQPAGVPTPEPEAAANVAVAMTQPETGAVLPSNGVPMPSSAPDQTVAVLPETPRPKERASASERTANADGQNAGSAATGRQPAEAKEVRVVRAEDDEDVTLTAYAPPRQAESVIEETQAGAAPNATGVSGMRWPVRGRVVAGYGQTVGSKPNDGIDIAVPEGTSVKAAENGVVIYAGDSLKEFGNTVLVRHEDGMVTVYGHASKLQVARGDKVKRGQEIALAGMSGSADMPKLHFEVRKDATPVDPSKYLE